jgi:glycosyltransferase A (GT-A) superfamily protein (DUF2064 family)
MQTFFEMAFAAAAAEDLNNRPKKVVVIGSDCPQLTAADIESAFKLLDQEPVVLGPSTDGGYYLIGMRNECADIFSGIDWSTERVLEQTIEHLRAKGIGYQCLSPKTDIDEYADLMTYRQQLASRQSADTDDALATALAKILPTSSSEPRSELTTGSETEGSQ